MSIVTERDSAAEMDAGPRLGCKAMGVPTEKLLFALFPRTGDVLSWRYGLVIHS